MTRVAIANVQAPFLRGGAELLAESLVAQFQSRGVEAHLIRVPFAWNPAELVLDHILATRLLRLGNIDRLIPLKFPAYALQHESKVVWLLHQFRQAYDLWGTPYQGIPNTPDGARIRQIIFNADNLYLNEARRIYTNSEVTGKRLSEFNNISSEILYPPLIAPELYYCDDADDYVFYPSRISPAKRQTLVVEAMQYVRSRTRLVIAGPPDTPDDLRAVKERIEQLSLQHRIELYPYWISDQEKAAFFAKALGCVYIPLDEDSYGYVTLESFEAQKPVVTCTDSGGTRTVVIDGETGWVVEPHPREIAEAIDRLASDRSHARELGAAGLELVRGMGISWDRVVEELLR